MLSASDLSYIPIPLIRWQFGRSTDSTSLEALSRLLVENRRKLFVYGFLDSSQKRFLIDIEQAKKKLRERGGNKCRDIQSTRNINYIEHSVQHMGRAERQSCGLNK